MKSYKKQNGFTRLRPKLHQGFTLIEIMIVIGIMGVLVAITINAVNPAKNFEDTQDAERYYSIKVLESAIVQYVIDGNKFIGLPINKEGALPICQNAITGTGCTVALGGYDLSPLSEDGEYIIRLPVDPTQSGSLLSGYYIYKDGSFIKVCSPVIHSGCAGS
ncbi:MAG: prepilin-type N-terminal cleavage/methylation domain-containing protein [Candidatus Peribacteraceae bacterium]|nr:prepilin-type N-terminal cleavage/methylation domain-containing protein [Candidatus Peribacteraceae bacterium]